MYKIYGDKRSGHCYKVQLVCALLDIEYQWYDVDLLKKEHLQDDFLSISPQHKVPVLLIDKADDQEILLESNSIIHYLAELHCTDDTYHHLIPSNQLTYTKLLQWQFYEQSQFQPPISTIRWIKHYQNIPMEQENEYKQKLVLVQENFVNLDTHLASHNFLTGKTFTLADITLFAYAHMANDGGIDFANYPNINAWIERVRGQYGFVEMGS